MAKNLRFDEFLSLIVPTAAAFIVAVNTTTLVQSFQANLILPILSLTPGVNGDFNNANIVLRPAELDENGVVVQQEVVLETGLFLSSLISFLIIIFITYLLIISAYTISKGKIDGTKKL